MHRYIGFWLEKSISRLTCIFRLYVVKGEAVHPFSKSNKAKTYGKKNTSQQKEENCSLNTAFYTPFLSGSVLAFLWVSHRGAIVVITFRSASHIWRLGFEGNCGGTRESISVPSKNQDLDGA